MLEDYCKITHPVSDEMRSRINDELDKIETKYNVKIIYACESGSRGWGFASTNSDYDVRFIYVNKPDHYVRVDNEARDVIEEKIDEELDIAGWNITKALHLAYKSNPTLIEWLESPIKYRQFPEDRELLLNIARQYFLPLTAYSHYHSMAKTTWKTWIESKDQVRLKKYFYVIRPLVAAIYIERNLKPAPMRFEELMANLDWDTPEAKHMVQAMDEIIEIKRAVTEQLVGNHYPALDNFIRMKFSEPAPVLPEYTRKDIYELSRLAWMFVDKYDDRRK